MFRNTRLVAGVCLLFCFLGAWFQGFGQGYDYFNQWYRFDQNYIRLLVEEDGMYRISAADLQAGGVDISGLVPENIQVFYRGKEQKIRVVKNGNALDFFEFWGRENDGHLDSLIYRSPITPFAADPTQQANHHSSLFSDTSAYFVTWDSIGTQRSTEIFPTNYPNFIPEPWYRHRSVFEWEFTFFKGGGGSTNVNHALNPDYITGEGFTGLDFKPGDPPNRAEHNMSTPGFANSGTPSRLQARVVHVNSANPHILELEVDGSRVYRDTTSGINVATRSVDLSFPLGNTTNIRFFALGQGSIIDYGRPLWHSLEYDRNFDLDGANETTVRQWARSDTTYLRFYNADVNAEAWLFDPASNQTIRATVANDTLHFLLPGFAGERTLYVYTDNAIRTPIVDARPDLANLSNVSAGAEFVIITHPNFANSAQAYAAYRDTNSVNAYSTKVVYVDEIMNEFGYGSLTPYAIKNFCKYALDNWTVTPKFFLLWGKGRPTPKADSRNNFVPVYGEPANDYEYVSNFTRTSSNVTPQASIGRVNIFTDQEGMDYLEKVIHYELSPYEPWRKEVVFLGGGKSGGEQSTISASIQNQFMPYVEAAPMGGQAWFFQRFNSGNITNSEKTSEEEINEGVGLIHFFGHSGQNIFDVDILEAKVYQNYDRVPFMIAFGCYGGDFSNDGKSFGERFILEPDRGSIGYFANSTAGFLNPLRNFGDDFYENLFELHYGEPIGDVIRYTIDQFATDGNALSDVFTALHAKQMNLQGDPAVVLRFPTQPDLRITDTDLFFDPENISALDNQYDLNLIVHNDGRIFADSFRMRVRHRAPNGTVLDYPDQTFGPITIVDTLNFPILNTLGPELAGLNQYEITVDALDSLDEYFESNNFILREEVIQGNIPAILFPYDFAVVDSNQIQLSASTWIITREENVQYAFEIDTVHTFDSPFRMSSGTIVGTSPFVSWTPEVALEPGQVYFWRVRLANVYPVQWNEASFKYIPGKTGWAQDHPAQFFRDPTVQIDMDETNLNWFFTERVLNLHCFIPSNGATTYFMGPYASDNPPDNAVGLFYVSFDQHTLEPNVQDGLRGDWNFVVAHDPGASSPGSNLRLLQDMAATRPGDYFLIASYIDPKFELWEPEWIKALEQIGVAPEQVADYQDGNQLIILGRKGDPVGSAIVIKEPNQELEGQGERYDLLIDLSSNYDSAAVISTPIGPASSWESMVKSWSSLDFPVEESFRTSVFGVRNNNTDAQIRTGLPQGQHGLVGIDADEYPFLRLEGTAMDDFKFTAPQLDNWEVYYVPAPDIAVDPTVAFSFPDSVEEGQIVPVQIGLRNVSEYDADSVLVRLRLQRSDRSSNVVGESRSIPLGAGDTTSLKIRFHTASLNLSGNVTLIVEVNPDNDQIEQHQFNNFYFHRMHVETDGVGPILDVVVDGKRLMDGDIVSPEPEITLQINDENEFLPVTVSDSTYRIWFGNERSYQLNAQVFIEGNNQIEEVTTGRLPSNKAELVFRPGRLGDGEYTLAVQAFDFKGNASGTEPYIIHFNVVNEKAISKVLPYPNPFSTSTRFVYTLTGDEKPYVFDIHIYTISGRLVKTIDLLALEDVNFGYNITEYSWDGRDEFGDALANGVYIYKANVKFRDRFGVGERDEGIDQFFNRNGYGKVYLMR